MKGQERNWLDLPHEVISDILHRIGSFEILENAQWVCTTWHGICFDPVMWRVIQFSHPDFERKTENHKQLRKMCKDAVDRSRGQLVDITIKGFGDDELLQYVADRSSQLRRFEIAFCYHDVYDSWMEALKKFPLLEELSIYLTQISKDAIETAGRYCPKLKTLKLMQGSLWGNHFSNPHNETAITIGENFPNLRHLELIADPMTNIGLEVILDRCRHLELLDLRLCLYINLERICLQNIRRVKLPKDSLQDCPYGKFFKDYDWCVRQSADCLAAGWLAVNEGDFPNMEDWQFVRALLSIPE